MLDTGFTREELDTQWTGAAYIANNLSPIIIRRSCTEANLLVQLLDQKLKTIQAIGNIIHGRGDVYTIDTFEGSLLGGLNNYRNDLSFSEDPFKFLEINTAIMVRLTVLRRFLELAFVYFREHGQENPLYETFFTSVYPDFMSWVNDQTDSLTVS